MMPALRLTGARVLLPGGLEETALTLAEGRIADGPGREVDLGGHLILPGVIDVHGDGFERHVAPRRGLVPDPGDGLPMLEAELAACGITTAWLAQFWSWQGGLRSPDFARAMAAALAGRRGALDLRLQLRVETHMIADFNAIARFVRQAGIGYVGFSDHLPHRALAAGKRPERLTSAALRAKRSPEAHLALMQELAANATEVPTALARLIAEMPGVKLASHDDDAATRARYAALGVEIAEFPVELPDAGPAVMGAPNVLRGGSHDRGPSAAEAVAEGRVTALASDYHYPAMVPAALKLAEAGLPLADAWHLISGGPAEMLGLANRGRIAPGLRADLVVLEAATGRVAATFAGGRPVYLGPEVAARLLA
ncbi:alpha-D-ribose 1-methylphosphonate 5-triphosphate diphosphatase [Pontivivens ytuae]